jgi:glycosyltransferase involved in cell wall biosynthesis
MTPTRRPRLCYVAASEGTVTAFLKQHIAAAGQNYEVSVAVNTDDRECLDRRGILAALRAVPIERKVSLLQDLRALWALYRLFRREHFGLVHSISPKAGLLAMLAAWLARVPRRVHSFTGQVWVTRRGWRRYVLKQADRLIAALATQTLIDSPSQRDFLVAEGVMSQAKAEVIGKGSICGVDGVRFHPDAQARREVRDSLGIPPNAPLLLFLGRLNRDKGVLDLATAFMLLVRRVPDAWLVLVGPDEEGLVPGIMKTCAGAADRVRHLDFTREPERYMAAADIFCLPSYREGFGTVVIEAAAAGLPSVASRIYGITDAVVDGVTGLLHPPGDAGAIEAVLAQLLADAPMRRTMGEDARKRALADFSQLESSRELMAFYGKMFD